MSSTITSPNPNAIIGYLPDGKPVYEIRGGSGEGESDESGTTEETSTEGSETEGTETEEDKGLDDKTKATLSKLRGEAAGWRTQLREAQEALKAAKTPEEFATVVSEFETKLAEKDRALVIERHKLPKELADLLPSGKTTEELDALAKNLAEKYVKTTDDDSDEDLAGGLSGTKSKGGASDPREAARRIRARQANNRIY